MYQTQGVHPQMYSKGMQYQMTDAGNFYVPNASLQQQQMYYNSNVGQYGAQRNVKNQMMAASNAGQKFTRSAVTGYQNQKNNGYQLKVGGVVVGSWANGSRNAALASRMNRNGMVK
jgi:flagellar hook protein FlgE